MAISTKDFTTMVRDQVTAIQAKSARFVNFTVGSVLRAILESNSAIGLWFQALIINLLSLTRASTSTAGDLDSWMADFGVIRLPAGVATGQVTFSRFTPTIAALIPFGSTVSTADGSQRYTVTVDTTHPAYTTSGYVVAAGVASVTVPVTAVVAGAAGNATIGQITSISQAISYIDTVSNTAAFTNGSDAEKDPALRARFILYLASLARATAAAIGYAITSVRTGITYKLIENQQYNGTTDNGYFCVIVDDGTGAPSSIFLDSVANAVDAFRGFTIRFGVFAPVLVNTTVTMVVTIAAGYDPVATRALVQVAIANYINSLPLGASLPYSILSSKAYAASPGITNVTNILLNGGTADITATAKQIVKSTSVVVS